MSKQKLTLNPDEPPNKNLVTTSEMQRNFKTVNMADRTNTNFLSSNNDQ